MNGIVVIEVIDGVSNVAYKDVGIDVVIIDFDERSTDIIVDDSDLANSEVGNA